MGISFKGLAYILYPIFGFIFGEDWASYMSNMENSRPLKEIAYTTSNRNSIC